MIQSMTGYGKADATYNGKKIHVEIKSLNSKALDLSTRLAPLYREKEMELRKLIQENLERGKVDFNLWIEKDTTAVGGVINADAVANYIYSRHGDDPEVQRLGWRGWLNKYYGDSLRSKMNIDPSGYKGMHISGGL